MPIAAATHSAEPHPIFLRPAQPHSYKSRIGSRRRTTSSNFVGCSTGSSAGLALLRSSRRCNNDIDLQPDELLVPKCVNHACKNLRLSAAYTGIAGCCARAASDHAASPNNRSPLEGGFRYPLVLQNYEQATRQCPRPRHRETHDKLAHGAARQVAPPYRGPIVAYLGCTFGSPPGVPGGGMTLR